jgi:allophanate hydrolase
MRVLAVPAGDLDLDEEHRRAWTQALAHAATVARVVPVDVTPFLEAARLLYEGALVAERYEAFGGLLEADGPHLDPTVRRIVRGGRDHPATAVFSALRRLAVLRSQALRVFVTADALLLPTTPGHPTLAEVAADPLGVNARLGTYTNMVNLLDLSAVAVPAGQRTDGLPFGVQLIAPAFADRPLLDLGSRWLGEPVPPADRGGDRALLAVAGAHLSGQPANPQLVQLGGRLHSRTRTAGGYRMYRVPGPFPRPGLVRTGNGPADGFEMELWDLPYEGLGRLLPQIAAPLALGSVQLADGALVTGFVATGADIDAADDLSGYDGWRDYLARG